MDLAFFSMALQGLTQRVNNHTQIHAHNNVNVLPLLASSPVMNPIERVKINWVGGSGLVI